MFLHMTRVRTHDIRSNTWHIFLHMTHVLTHDTRLSIMRVQTSKVVCVNTMGFQRFHCTVSSVLRNDTWLNNWHFLKQANIIVFNETMLFVLQYGCISDRSNHSISVKKSDVLHAKKTPKKHNRLRKNTRVTLLYHLFKLFKCKQIILQSQHCIARQSLLSTCYRIKDDNSTTCGWYPRYIHDKL